MDELRQSCFQKIKMKRKQQIEKEHQQWLIQVLCVQSYRALIVQSPVRASNVNISTRKKRQYSTLNLITKQNPIEIYEIWIIFESAFFIHSFIRSFLLAFVANRND